MSAKNIHKILVIGSTGLVGSRFVDLYRSKFSVTTLGRNNVDIKTDLTSEEDVLRSVNSSDADAVINFAAYTNVDGAQEEKGDRTGEVYTINTLLPFWLAKSCEASGKRLYHISTDYVFDGKRQDRPYTEKDTPCPVNSWYSITKYKGEREIANIFRKEENFAIIRISYPYSGLYERKLDVARTVVKRLSMREPYAGITDQKIKPTSVDDIADALGLLLNKLASGIFHVAGNFLPNVCISPFGFAQKISSIFALDSSFIKPILFSEFSKTRAALRPQHTWLDTTKMERFGFKFTNIEQSLARFKRQLSGS